MRRLPKLARVFYATRGSKGLPERITLIVTSEDFDELPQTNLHDEMLKEFLAKPNENGYKLYISPGSPYPTHPYDHSLKIAEEGYAKAYLVLNWRSPRVDDVNDEDEDDY